MIRKLKLKNFKCFSEIEIPFEGVNVLSGINGMGKSTIVQALLLIRQSYLDYEFRDGLYLNGSYVNVGTGKDILYEKGNEDEGISLEIEEDEEYFICNVKYLPEENILPIVKIKASYVANMNIFSKSFTYLSAMRIAPESFYNLLNMSKLKNKQLGASGEYAIQYLSEFGSSKIENTNVIIGDIEDDNQLSLQVKRWLDLISPGVNAIIEQHKSLNVAELRYEYTEGTYRTNEYRSINVGFGITYVLPIVVALLSAKKDEIIIIENPEAHLHPSGQRMIGELIARAGSGGAQIFIESHSDHILNGIRLSVRNQVIKKEKVNLMFFYKDIKDDYKHKFITPKIEEDGKLDKWPEGFFDEWDKALFQFF